MPYDFTLTTILPGAPQPVYESWMSSEGHTAMTGGVAHIGKEVGTRFDAWDGYISGETVELVPGQRIRQTWRTAHFGPDDVDSVIEIELKAEGEGTLLTLTHSNVPDGQTSYEESGWRQYYFEPMKRRFEWLRLRQSMLEARE